MDKISSLRPFEEEEKPIQPSQPAQSVQNKVESHNKSNIKYLIILLAVSLLSTPMCSYYFYNLGLNNSKTKKETIIKPTTITPSIEPTKLEEPTPAPSVSTSSKWKSYKSSNYDVTFDYPSKLIVTTDNSTGVILEPQGSEEGMPKNFIYVVKIPSGSKSVGGDFYNYNYPEFTNLMSMNVGDRKVSDKKLNAEMAKYYTYTRLPDNTVAGVNAKIFSNNKLWEFPEDVTEYRYYLEKDKFIYLIGGYVGEVEKPDTYMLDKKTFDEFVKSFAFAK